MIVNILSVNKEYIARSLLNMDWKLYSFVVRSEQRKMLVIALKSPKTPTELSKELKLGTSHVSRTLKEFSDKKIVECLTPKEKIGKIYQLTSLGKEILEKLNKS